MTWTRSSGVRSSITKIAVAGVLIGIPVAAVSFPACATPDLGGASIVLPAPLPADPPTNEPAPPPAPVQSNSAEDYWYNWYNLGADGGGGGGGGG
ncbi:hypothetical protein [Mycobacterium sp.]|uniref:hypothetical protein n=1 Tax=Mycobacterium sp. TaxID=1785 RepID=UPI003F95B082